MAIGRRPEARQQDMFVAASEIRAGGSPFYRALDRLLRENGFDGFAEETKRKDALEAAQAGAGVLIVAPGGVAPPALPGVLLYMRIAIRRYAG